MVLFFFAIRLREIVWKMIFRKRRRGGGGDWRREMIFDGRNRIFDLR